MMRNGISLSLAFAMIIGLLYSCKKDENGDGNGGAASVAVLGCNTASFSAVAVKQIIFNGTATVPYSGGNGASFSAGSSIPSSGVTGLTATLDQGSLTSGSGNITFKVAGAPSDTGIASFAISFGGQSCSLQLSVTGGGGVQVPAPFNKIYGASNISFDGTWVIIKTSGLPDHKSVYWPTNNALYEAFSGLTFQDSSFRRAPGNLMPQNITLKIPAFPAEASTHAPTPMGVIGVGINGVPFFNQYAAGGTSLSAEMRGFDQWWGHPQMTGMYHYHVEPKYLTTVKATKSSLVGFLLDGFPVYGPLDPDGTTPTNLDAYHGHTHITPEYTSGIYHYHFSATAPYLNGNGFWGSSGTVTQ